MRVLGLDIQPNAVACVEMDTAFGRFEVRDTHEMKLEEGMDPIGAASQLLLSLPKRGDRLITTVPVSVSTFRNLQIASKDKKAIRQALEFELEDDLPFESDHLHYDSVIMNTGPQGACVHVGAVKKDSFQNHLNGLQNYSIDPDVMTTDAWAYRCLIGRIQGQNPDAPPVMLIGLERDKTFFYVHDQGQPILYREVPFGLGSVETELVAQHPDIGSDEATRWITSVGVTQSIDEHAASAISDILDKLIPEIKQTELAARSTLSASIDQIWVTGEGALMPGVIGWMEEATEKTVALFRPLSLISPGQVNYSETSEVRFAKALAMTMTAVPIDKLHTLNLRRGEFSKTGQQGFSTFDLVKKPLPYLVILLSVLLATKTIEVKYYQGKLDETDDVLKRSVKAYFSGIGDGAVRNYLADTSKLKKTIEGDLAKERELAKLLAPNANSPFDFLRILSQKIGKDIVLDMVDYDVGTDFTENYKDNRPVKAAITFIVQSATSLSKLTDIMEKTYSFKKGPSEELSVEGHKAFKIQFTGGLNGSVR
ncbi:MAG: pilus assembly protein PilM [Bdellovibrionales bacterium]|nr:pilus assembly protein PilM [Bdellovibrionales bacterium]